MLCDGGVLSRMVSERDWEIGKRLMRSMEEREDGGLGRGYLSFCFFTSWGFLVGVRQKKGLDEKRLRCGRWRLHGWQLCACGWD